jgi:hypothetical protein
MDTERENYFRQKYEIPKCYRFSMMDATGAMYFDFTDSTIIVQPNGQATETHLGLSSGARGHEFITSSWPNN